MTAILQKTIDTYAPASRDGGLKLVCLILSIVLHMVLAAVVFQCFTSVPDGPGPVFVSLLERQISAPPRAVVPAPPASPRVPSPERPSVRALPAAPSGSPAAAPVSTGLPPLSAGQPAVPTEEPTLAPAVPAASEAPVTEAGGDGAVPGKDEAGGGSGGSGDAATGTGSGGKKGGTGRGAGGHFVKAVPRYESNPWPAYPRMADRKRPEGTVRLRVKVTVAGDVEGVTLERSSGHEALDRAALETVPRWRFIPATLGGAPVPCEISVPVAFRLK